MIWRIFCCLASLSIFASSIKDLAWLTFEETNTVNSITVNLQSFGKHSEAYVYYGVQSDNYTQQALGKVKFIEGVDRTYHAIKLNNLKANTQYYFIAGNEEIGYTKEYKFKTLPGDDTPLKMIVGGDLG